MSKEEGEGKAAHLGHSYSPHREVLPFQPLNPEKLQLLQLCSCSLVDCVVFVLITESTPQRRVL